jgi:hypothetical protein
VAEPSLNRNFIAEFEYFPLPCRYAMAPGPLSAAPQYVLASALHPLEQQDVSAYDRIERLLEHHVGGVALAKRNVAQRRCIRSRPCDN